jgi:hypothetical protein
MVAIRTRLSADTDVPAEVKALADELIAIVNRHDSRIACPAASMLFAFVILESAGRGDDMSVLNQILLDVCAIITEYEAVIPRHAH